MERRGATSARERNVHLSFFATAAKGTEPLLRDELRMLRLRGIRADRGGVHFAGEMHDGFRACLDARIAVRILLEIGRFSARTGDELYAGVKALEWAPYVTPRLTLAVAATCRASTLTHTRYVEQKTKDAIVDQLRDKHGERPSVDTDDPDLRVSVRVMKDEVTIYVDLAGESLHRRGFRTFIGEAPLKETLAAALIRFSEWGGETPFVDPMCGSGTIPIEAALMARDVAPGLARARFGVERWPRWDATLVAKAAELREAARARIRDDVPEIIACDLDPHVLEAARRNAEAAGVTSFIRFHERPVAKMLGTSPAGTIVTNPPYGERLEADLPTYRDLGDAIGRRLRDHGACVLAGTPEIPRAISRRETKALAVFNGPIECRALLYRAERDESDDAPKADRHEAHYDPDTDPDAHRDDDAQADEEA